MKAPWFLLLFATLMVSGVALLAAVSVGRQVDASGGVASVSTGADHFTCALTASGGARCWGNNADGQLGNGTTSNSSTPMDVNGLTSGVVAVDSGDQHTCAVTASGGAKCWGDSADGELGNGSTSDSSVPVDVSGLASGVGAVSAGYHYTCALTVTGGVKCWGSNALGHLGDGTSNDSSVPVDVVGLSSGASAVSAGYTSTCALTTAGGVKCWGFGSMTPADVPGLTSGVAALSAGYNHACALTLSDGVKCWGNNSDGQLGNGTTTGSSTPVNVTGLTSGVVAVSAGLDYSCAVTSGGSVKCWGTNTFGQLGNGTTTPSATPVAVSGIAAGAASVSAGRYHTCANMTGGALRCWGDNSSGQLGDGTTTDSHTSVAVAKPTLTPQPTATSTPLPPKDPDADADGDTVVNSVDPDDDNDTCPDVNETQEAAGSEVSGGRRNPHDANDYFNPTGDGVNRVDDILMVVNAYFDDDSDSNPGLPPYAPGYNPDTDRTLIGPLAWNLGPPNGLQRVDDILNAVKQYFHDCS